MLLPFHLLPYYPSSLPPSVRSFPTGGKLQLLGGRSSLFGFLRFRGLPP